MIWFFSPLIIIKLASFIDVNGSLRGPEGIKLLFPTQFFESKHKIFKFLNIRWSWNPSSRIMESYPNFIIVFIASTLLFEIYTCPNLFNSNASSPVSPVFWLGVFN